LGAQELLLTVHKLADSVGIYDAQSGRSLANIPVGRKPHEVGVSADERWAFVTNYGLDSYTQAETGGNTISVIDLRERKVAGEISTGEFTRPHGIERGRSGLFYVTTEIPAAIHILDGSKRKILQSVRIAGKQPHMLVLSEDESRLWTADSGSGTITCVSIPDRKEVASIQVGGVPMGLALTRDGRRLFAATRTDNQIHEIDAHSNKLLRSTAVAGEPVRLVLAQNESLLLATTIASGELVALNAQDLKEIKRVKAGARAEGMGLHPAGEELYVSAQGDNTIHRFLIPGLQHDLAIPTAAKPDPILILRSQKSRGR
jgi:DNA-binding beta-propeller fold protein YncE